MGKLFVIGLGGWIGSVLRYLVGGYIQQLTRSVDFPYGTLGVNLIGCFVIGLLAQLIDARGVLTSEWRAFLLVGVMGGFTTFSAFGNETMNLFRQDAGLPALINIGAHIILGLGAVWLGRTTAYLVWR